jgi:hypothetical protein
MEFLNILLYEQFNCPRSFPLLSNMGGCSKTGLQIAKMMMFTSILIFKNLIISDKSLPTTPQAKILQQLWRSKQLAATSLISQRKNGQTHELHYLGIWPCCHCFFS